MLATKWAAGSLPQLSLCRCSAYCRECCTDKTVDSPDNGNVNAFGISGRSTCHHTVNLPELNLLQNLQLLLQHV